MSRNFIVITNFQKKEILTYTLGFRRPNLKIKSFALCNELNDKV